MSETAKHTPGEWGIVYLPYPCAKNGAGEPNPPAAFIGPVGDDAAIALVFGDDEDDPFDSPSQRAYANLFLAAPDLLEALEGVLRVAGRNTVEFDAARVAIAKAKGEAKP